MAGQSSRSQRRKSKDIDSAISSPASGDGLLLFPLPDGQEIEKSGQEVAPVRLSRRQQEKRDAQRVRDVLSRALAELDISSASSASIPGSPTKDISGQSSGDSSAIAGPLQSLVNRSLEEMDWFGSLEFEVRLKRLDTILLPPIFQLVQSVRRISDIDFSGWPTANASDGKGPNVGNSPKTAGKLDLPAIAQMSGWPTPVTPNGGRTGMRQCKGREGQLRHLESIGKMFPWSTPNATDGSKAPEAYARGNLSLVAQVKLVCWATPNATDGKRGEVMPVKNLMREQGQPKCLSYEVQIFGPEPLHISVRTEKPGVLNPAFSLWLMGFSAEWAYSGVRAMLSFHKWRPDS